MLTFSSSIERNRSIWVFGQPEQQVELCNAINDVFETNTIYEEIPVDAFTKNRQQAGFTNL